MDDAHQKADHGNTGRAAAESQVAIGQVAGRGAGVSPEPSAFDPNVWMRPARPRSPWPKRAGIGLTAGAVATLGWFGGQFMQSKSNSIAKVSPAAVSADEENLFGDAGMRIDDSGFGDVDAFLAADDSVIRGQGAPGIQLPGLPPATGRQTAEIESDENPFATMSGKSETADSAFSSREQFSDRGAHQVSVTAGVESEGSVLDRAGWESTNAAAEPEPDPDGGRPLAETADEFAWESAAQASEEPRLAPEPPALPAIGAEFGSDEIDTAPPQGQNPALPAAPHPVAAPPALSDSPFEFAEERPSPPPAFEEPDPQPRGFAAPFEPKEIQPATALESRPEEKVHVVQPGETYWSIAQQHFAAGRYFNALAEYNKPRIANARALKPGMKVLVPEADFLDEKYAKLAGSSAVSKKRPPGLFFDDAGHPFYRVGPSDSLSNIAQRHLGRSSRSSEIFEMNQDVLKSPDRLKLGTILKMPENASQVEAIAPVPADR